MPGASRYERAIQLESRGAFAEAESIFEQLLLSTAHDRGDIFFHCGWCLEQGTPPDWERALFCYREAAEITQLPLCRINSLFRAGWVAMHLKDYPAAAHWFKKAIDAHERTPISETIFHDALYWYAVCLEAQGHYLEAISWHHRVQQSAPMLTPESRFREIQCLNRVGAYRQALAVCRTFSPQPPKGFDPERYNELYSLVQRETGAIRSILADDFMQKGNQ